MQTWEEELLEKATEFRIGSIIHMGDVFIARRHKTENSWAVINGGCIWDKDLGLFVYEPMPSNRTEKFIGTTRMTLKDAYTTAKWIIDNEKEVLRRMFDVLGPT